MTHETEHILKFGFGLAKEQEVKKYLKRDKRLFFFSKEETLKAEMGSYNYERGQCVTHLEGKIHVVCCKIGSDCCSD